MRLSTRLIAAFILCTTIPLTAAALINRQFIETESREHTAYRLETAERTVRVVYADLVRDQRMRLDNLCRSDPLLETVLVRLARRRPEVRSQLQSWTVRQATALGLDTLDVLASDGTVLASSHHPGRQGELAPPLAQVADQARGGALLAPLSVRTAHEGERPLLTLVTSCRAERAGVQVTLAGGRFAGRSLGPAVSTRLDGGDIYVFILDENRQPIGAGAPRWRRAQELQRVLMPFENQDGTRRAWLAIAVDDLREINTIKRLDRVTMAVIALGIAVSWLLGMLLARRIAYPLSVLSKQANVVAGGELTKGVDVRAGGEIGHLVDAFNTMVKDLKESRDRVVRAERIAAWRDIARRIAHEIKNPLFPIQTSIETVRKAYKKQHPEFEEIFDEATVMILEEVERLKRIVTEFSRFARLPKPEPETLDVEEFLSNVTSMYTGGEMDLETRFSTDLPQIEADREQLTQVFHNLIQNAMDACEGGQGSVRVVAEPWDDQGVTISVSDGGTGMDEQTVAKIFEPYFTTKEGRGTGLGLSIVHRIVTDHGGTIAVKSTEGKGSVFTIHLTTCGPPPERESLPAG